MDNTMNDEDLKVAMMFFQSRTDGRGIVLQCPRVADIPYMRHDIIRLFGQPDRILFDAVVYDRRPMRFAPLSVSSVSPDRSLGYNEGDNQFFYIGFADGRDHLVLDRYDIMVDDRPWRAIQLWKSIGLSVYSMLKALRDMGYDEGESVSFLANSDVQV
jgi:hypothetical protein